MEPQGDQPQGRPSDEEKKAKLYARKKTTYYFERVDPEEPPHRYKKVEPIWPWLWGIETTRLVDGKPVTVVFLEDSTVELLSELMPDRRKKPRKDPLERLLEK